MTRGFYSIMQYCPDRFRAEAVNVGLVLLRENPYTLYVKTTNNYDRICKLFVINESELDNLKISINGLANKIIANTGRLQTSNDLIEFAASLANDLRLVEPRLVKFDDFSYDSERLFIQLVECRIPLTFGRLPAGDLVDSWSTHRQHKSI